MVNMKIYLVTDLKNIGKESSIIYLSILKSFISKGYRGSLFGDQQFYLEAKFLSESDIVIFANANFYFLQRIEFEIFLKSINAFKVYIGFDDEYMINTSLYFSQFMNLMVTFDLVAYNYYRSLGFSTLICPHPVEVPSVNKNSRFEYDISFIGEVDKLKSSRIKLLEKVACEFSKCYFPGLTGKRVSNFEMASIFHNTKINLNLTGVGDYGKCIELLFNNHRRGSKGRPYEIGAAGGFCLSEFSPSIELFLNKGLDIDYFNGADDLINKIEYYLKNDSFRYNMAASLNKKILSLYSSDSNINSFSSQILDFKKKFRSINTKNLYGCGSLLNSPNTVDFKLEERRLLFNLKKNNIINTFKILKELINLDVVKSISFIFNLLKLKLKLFKFLKM